MGKKWEVMYSVFFLSNARSLRSDLIIPEDLLHQFRPNIIMKRWVDHAQIHFQTIHEDLKERLTRRLSPILDAHDEIIIISLLSGS